MPRPHDSPPMSDAEIGCVAFVCLLILACIIVGAITIGEWVSRNTGDALAGWLL